MLPQFALFLMAGMAGVLCLMPRAQVPSAFFRIQMLVFLGLSVLLALASPQSRYLAIVLAVTAFAGSALWTLERRFGGTVVLFLVGFLSTAELIRASLGRGDERVLWVLSHLATAGTLGGTMTGMLLGHRYLTAPGMPLRPLEIVNTILGAAVVLRAGVSFAAFALMGAGPLGGASAVWLALRWLAGVVGPAVAVVLVWRILKYRNTQSATGVLFAAVVLAFIGELSASLLAEELHRPL